MRIFCCTLLSFILFSTNTYGQQIWLDDFDGSNTTATFNAANLCGGNPELSHFGVVCENGGGCAANGFIEMAPAFTGLYNNLMGNFLGAYDTDRVDVCGPVGDDYEFAEWTGIDISSCLVPDELYLCFDIASWGNGLIPSEGWDPPSNVTISVTIDGTPFTLTSIEDQGQDSNPAFDLDCDMVGDSNPLTNALTTYCFQIPGQGTALDILIAIDGLNETAEDLAIDNVSVYCSSDESTLPGPVLLGCGACGIDGDCDGFNVVDDCDDNDASITTPNNTPDATQVSICQNETCYDPYSDNNTIFSAGTATLVWYDGNPSMGALPLPNPSCLDFTVAPIPELYISISDNNCPATAPNIVPITVNFLSVPTAMITGDDPTCSGSATNLDAGSTDMTNGISWMTVAPSDGSFTSNNINNTMYTPGPLDITNGSATVMVTVSSISGCMEVDMFTFNINELDDASFDYVSNACASGTNIFPSVSPVVPGVFSIDNGATIDATTGEISIGTTTGGQSYTITFTSTGPCPNVAMDNITIDVSDDASFDYVSNACASGTNIFPSVSPSVSGTFSIDNGATIDATTGEISIGTTTAGQSYTITFTSTGACPDVAMDNITIDVSDDASFDYVSNACANGSNIFPLVSPSVSGVFSIDNGATIDATTGEISIGTTTAGQSYTITFTSTGACPDVAMDNITIDVSDDASFDYVPNACASGTNIFPSVSPVVSGVFSIDNGATIDATSGEISIGTTTGGQSYTITFTSTGACPDVAMDNITIDVSDDASFDYVSNACANGSNIFPLVSPSVSGVFSIDNGAMIDATTGEISIGTTTAGQSYTITFTSTGACPDVAMDNMTIDVSDDASFDYVPNACASGTNIFPSVSPSVSGVFSIDNGATIDATSGEILIGTTIGGQSYTITFTSTGACPDVAMDNIMIDVSDNASFDYPATACASGGNIFPDVLPGSTGMFSIDNGGAMDGTSGEILIGSLIVGQTYNITFTSTGPCPDVFVDAIMINDLDDVVFDYPATACINNGNIFPDALPGSTGSFSINGGGLIDPSTGEISIGSLIAGQTYNITFTSTGPCPNVFMDAIMINDLDDVVFDYPATACINDGNVFPDALPGSTGSFSINGGGSIDPTTGEIFIGSLIAGQTYNITFTSTGTCPDIFVDAIMINDLDDVVFDYPATACVNDGNVFPDALPGSTGSFSINGGGSIDPTSGEIFIGSLVAGQTYNITFTSTGTCPDVFVDAIMVNDLDDVVFEYPESTCASGGNIFPNALPGSTGSFSINGGGLIDATTGEISIGSLIGGQSYNITFTSTGACPDISADDIFISTPPNAGTANAPATTCNENGSLVNLNTLLTGADAGGVWTETTVPASTGLSGNQFDGTGQVAGTYTFRYTVSATNCPDDFTDVMVTVEEPLTATITGSSIVCNNSNNGNVSVVDFNSLITAGTTTGTWVDTDGSGVDLANLSNVSFDGVAANTYTFTYTTPTNGDCLGEIYTTSILVENCVCPSTTTNENHDGCEGDGYEIIVNGIAYNEGNRTGTETLVSFNTGCDSIIVINLMYAIPPNAGTANAPVTTCNENGSLVNLNTLLTGADAGGVWTETTVPASTGLSGNQFDGTGQAAGTYSFRYTVSATNCPDDFTDVMVTVEEPLTATITGSSIVCNNSNNGNVSVVDFNSLITAGTTTGTWVDTDGSGVDLANLSNVSFDGVAANTYTFTYTTPTNGDCLGEIYTTSILVENCVCPSTTTNENHDGCEGDGYEIIVNGIAYNEGNRTGTETLVSFNTGCDSIIVINLMYAIPPNAGTANAPVTTCNENGSLVNLNTLLTGADAGGVWTETTVPASTGLSGNQFDGTGQAAGTYSFRYTVSATNCPDDFTDVMVTVEEPLTATITGSSIVCNNSNNGNVSVVDFNSLITAGTTTGTWVDTDGSGVDLANLSNVSFDGVAANTYTFTYTTPTNGDCLGEIYTTSILVENCVCPSTTTNENHDGCEGDGYEIIVNGIAYNEGNRTGTETLVSFNTGCDSIIVINLMYAIPPNAGTANAPVTTCNENGSLVNLNTLLTGADAGGVWTETTVPASTGLSGNQFDGTGQAAGTYSFRYTVSATNCPDDFTEVMVIVEEPFTATLTGSSTVCSNSNNGNVSVVNFNDLITAGNTTGTWVDTDGSGVDLANLGSVSFDGITADTYTFTYTTPSNGECAGVIYTTSIVVEDCVCPSTTTNEEHDGCEGDGYEIIVNGVPYNQDNRTGTETLVSFNTGCDSIIIINLMYAVPPNAGTANGPVTTCNENGSIVNLNDLLSGADAGGVWTETTVPPSSGLSGNQFDGTGQAAGTYTFRYTVSTANCPDSFTEVMVTVEEPLTATVFTSSTVCNNSNNGNVSVVNFNDLITAGNTTGTWVDTDGSGVDLANLGSVSFDGITADTYTFTYTTPSNGECAGVIYTTSIVVEDCVCPSTTTNEEHDGCEGDGYEIIVNGIAYNEGNRTGTETLVSFNTGCDSIIVINLMYAIPPNAGTANGPATTCNENGSLVNLNDLLTGADAGGVWTETTVPASTGLSGNQFDGTGQVAGTYSFRYTVSTTNCPDAFTEVMVTVEEPLMAVVTGSSTICNNSDNGNVSVVNFNSLITAGNTTGTWVDTDGSGVDLADLTNVSFDGVIPNTYTFTYTTSSNGECAGSVYTTSIVVEDCVCPSTTTNEDHDGCEGDGYEIIVNGIAYNEGNRTGTETLVSFNTGCDSIIVINLMYAIPPNAGTANGPATTCNENGSLVNLNDLLTGADAGGVWTETTVPASTGLSGNQFDGTGQVAGTYSFRYTVSTTNCPDAFTEVMVTVEEPLMAVVTGSSTICNNSDNGNVSVVNFNSLITAGNTTGTWVDTDGSGVDLADLTNVSFDGVIPNTYTFTYTTSSNGACAGSVYTTSIIVEDCVCPSTTTNEDHDGCEGDGYEIIVNGIAYNEGNRTGTETLVSFNTGCDSIIVINLMYAIPPNAGTANGPATTCNENGSLVNLNDLLTGADAGGVWTETTVPASTGLSGNQFDGTGQVAGTYSFRYTVSTTNCPDDFTEVMVTVEEPLMAIVTGSSTICNNSDNGNVSVVNFNSLITAGNTTGTWVDTDGSGVDLADLTNVSFDGVIPNTYTFTYTTSSNGECAGSVYTTSIIVEDCVCPSTTTNEDHDGCEGDGYEIIVNGIAYNEGNRTGTETLVSFNTGCDSIIVINLMYAVPPNAGTANAPVTTCNENGSIVNLNDLLSGADAGGVWTETTVPSSSGLSGNQFDGTGQAAGTYTFRYTVSTANCPDAFTEVMVTVEEPLMAIVTGSSTICNNSDNGNVSVVNFNSLITAGNTTGTWVDTDGSGVDLADLTNVSFDGVIPNTYTFTYTTSSNGECAGSVYTTSIIVEDCLCPSTMMNEEYSGCSGDGYEVMVNNVIYNEANPTGVENLISSVTGCDSIVNVDLVFSPATTLVFSTMDPQCFGDNNGAISIDSVVGDNGPFVYSIDNGPLEVITSFPILESSLEPGDYLVLIEDSEGCETETSISISAPIQNMADLGRDTSIFLGESIELELFLNFIPDSILWTSTLGDGCTNCISQSVSPTSTNTYMVYAEDAADCGTTTEVLVTVVDRDNINIPNAFSPNNDGLNETWVIPGILEYPDNQVVVVNRWGNIVFEANGYQNDWDGTNKSNKPLAEGTYYYNIKLDLGEGEVRQGSITIIR